MKVELKRINEPYHFEVTNQIGNSIHIDASPQIGGTDKGVLSDGTSSHGSCWMCKY